ncbi:MAG TPA: hypothetical protein VGD69_05425 [Herpetosiphonaceae bacterium]
MFKRLCVLFLLITATVSVSPPAQAATLYVELDCQGFNQQPFYLCLATTYGGTGSYTSYRWKIKAGAYAPTYTTTSSSRYDGYCSVKGMPYTVTVTVTDSGGATGTSASSTFRCMMDEY